MFGWEALEVGKDKVMGGLGFLFFGISYNHFLGDCFLNQVTQDTSSNFRMITFLGFFFKINQT